MNQQTITNPLKEMQHAPSCGVCGAARVTTSWVEHTFTYGIGQSAVELTARVPVHSCAACEFEYLDEVGERLKHEAVCRHLSVLPPAEIRRIRKSHNMTRVQFSEVTGLGEASLNRWENGINIQTHANDRYLRLLENPRAIRQLKHMAAREKSTGPDSGLAESPFQAIDLNEARRKRAEGRGFRMRPNAHELKAA